MKKQKLTGGEAIALYMKKQEIPYAVGIPGHGCLGLVDAFLKHEIPIIQVRHEQSATHLADGYFRAKGKPLVVFTSIGPGGCNTTIGVATAFVDSTAMIVITGGVHVRWQGVGVLQEIERKKWADFSSILQPIVKKSYPVTSLEHLPWALHNAFKTAVSGRPGPVHIDIPMDIQSEAREIELYDDLPFEINQYRSYPDPDRIHKAVDLLVNSTRPVILAGGGVLSSKAFHELKDFAEYLGIPVVCTLAGKGSFPENHPLFGFYPGTKGSPIGNDLTRNADTILGLGCRFADETTSSYEDGVTFSIPPTKLIQVDIDEAEVGKNYHVDLPILCDIKTTLNQMIQDLQERGIEPADLSDNSRVKYIFDKKAAWMKSLQPLREQDSPMTISRLLLELRKAIPKDSFVVTSAGHTQAALFQEFPILTENTHISSGGFSTMGFGVPAALGVKLAYPERTVISVEGDGSFLMTCQELAVASQLNIPVIFIIADNSGWISIRDLQINAYVKNRKYATEFETPDGKPYSPDFVQLAKSFNCWAQKCENSEEFSKALHDALNLSEPAVLWVPVERKHPMSESPVYGSWDVPKPNYLDEP